jgi:hypothetical protein
MPIQINLLSESFAAEEAKRNDPVKCATWVGAFCVFLVLLWYSTLMFEHMVVASQLEEKKTEWSALENDNKSIRELSAGIKKATDNIVAMDRLATNRFLWAPVLDALTQTWVDDVEVISLKTRQTYVVVVPPKEENEKRKNPLPSSATENILLTVDARDYGDQTQQKYNAYRDLIARSEYFESELEKGGMKLAQLLPPSTDPLDAGRSFVQFSLECKFPEKVRK